MGRSWLWPLTLLQIGFKLVWGCLFFYPMFYCIGLWPLVHATGDIGGGAATLIVALYLLGWGLTRGANNQKYYFKLGHTGKFLGVVEQRALEGTRILCSGFWGLARHINYLGEVLQAVALALPGWLVSGSPLPWLYPLYYVALLVPRQLEDDRLCKRKYGDVWDRYVALVPYRIVPGVW